MTKSPVLFLTFNRLDTTKQVFEALRQAQPPRLYLASDGPRQSRPLESKQVEEIRQFLCSNVDWPCDVKILFQEENLGCKLGVSKAITWFFEHEESGVILEDDCLPHPDFFQYCDELLEYYKDDNEIFMLSGTNIRQGTPRTASYFFSATGSIWGWASWRRAWNNYTLDIRPSFTRENWRVINIHVGNAKTASALEFVIRCSVVDKVASTWDYQWLFATLLAGGKCIVPATNLISNIGFGVDPTHTFDPNDPLSNLKVNSLSWPLIHPSSKIIDADYDAFHASHINDSAKARFKAMIKRLLRRWL